MSRRWLPLTGLLLTVVIGGFGSLNHGEASPLLRRIPSR